MKFNCPHCNQRLQALDEYASMSIRCPQCQEVLTVPDAPPPEERAATESVGGGKEGGNLAASGRKFKVKSEAASIGDRPTSRAAKWSDSTNISFLFSGLLGLAFTVLVYLLMLPFRNIYLGELFLARGWVPYVLTLLMGWCLGFVVLKWQKLARQKNSLLLDLLPAEISEEIDTESVGAFLEHVYDIPLRLRESFMVNRIRRALEHFQVRKSNPEVANLLMAQSEIDAGAVQSSYSVVKVFIWAIPILGFIGTVLGISGAIGGFAGALDEAQDIELLKESLNSVTAGLALAFDTTLLALIMSLLVSFPISAMQKREEDFLGRVDEYCNDNLLKRMNDAGGVATVATNTHAILESLGEAVSRTQSDVIDDLKSIQEQAAASQEQLRDYLEEAIKLMKDQATQMGSQAGEHRKVAEESLLNMTKQVGETMLKASEAIGATMKQQSELIGKSTLEHQKRVEESLASISAPVQQAAGDYAEGLKLGLERLNAVLESLGEKQVVVQVQQAPRRGWLFGSRKG